MAVTSVGTAPDRENKEALARFLAPCIPGELQRRLVEVMARYYGGQRLEEALSCPPGLVQQWLQGDRPDDVYLAGLVVLAAAEVPPARELLQRELAGPLEEALRQLGLAARPPLEKALALLDTQSRALIWYLYWHGHASLAELAACIQAPTDFEVLQRLREVINPWAREHLGHPVAEFRERAVEPASGAVVLFHWWYSGDTWTGGGAGPLVDMFDEGDHLVLLAEVPAGSDAEGIRCELHNGLLQVTLPRK